MKSPSKTMHSLKQNLILVGLMGFLSLFFVKPVQAAEDLFSVVPAGDSTYAELHQLAKAGWLSEQDVASSSLTRFEVAKLVVKAERNSGEMEVAQATQATPIPEDMLLPPPESTQAAGGAEATPTGPAMPTAAQKAMARSEAAAHLRSLQEAYDYEIKKVKDQLKSLEDKADAVDAEQYDLRKHIKGVTQYPTVAIHGLGRAFGLSQQYSGNDPVFVSTNNPSGIFVDGQRSTTGYLDLNPVGTVSKQVRWNLTLRLGSTFLPNSAPTFLLRRVTMEFNPEWLSATVGDFDEAYTPFTLWNRNTLDLAWKPEMWARQDDYFKYESFLNHEPYWPFRGLKLGESLMWPQSDLLEGLKTSAFTDIIRNGILDNGGYYFGPGQFTSWVFGGTATLKTKKWYTGSNSWQGALDLYGVILDEPLNSEPPISVYDPHDPTTWAHQYLTGSVKPDVKAGLGDDVYVGGTAEYAFSSYQDDKLNAQRVISDSAIIGGAYLQFGNSRIFANYLNVDPYYYAPLAQTRQDAVTQLPETASDISPELFEAPLRSQYFLPGVPRAGGIFGFYDRTMDNVFPYGLATPNRNGFGLDMDIQTLKENSLKIKGSAYLVSEINSNLVLGPGQTQVAVDGLLSQRSFTYVNIGPSFNLGPYIGFERKFEVGADFRYEDTSDNTDNINLTSTWIIGGVSVEVLPAWQVSAAFSQRNSQGTEEGFRGSLWSRYSYLFDSSDLGQYSLVNINGNVQSLRFSTAFKVNLNSSIYLDYDYTTGTMLPGNPNQGTVNNQFAEVTYEVQF